MPAAGFIGLSGPYDIAQIPDLAHPLFGVTPAEDPGVWREGNPMTWTALRVGAHPLAALLAHGDADRVVPVGFTRSFAQALRDAGHPVRMTIVPGADHAGIYTPKVIADTVVSWVDGRWPAPRGN